MSSDEPPLAAILGGVAGGVVVLAIAAIAAFLFVRSRRRRHAAEEEAEYADAPKAGLYDSSVGGFSSWEGQWEPRPYSNSEKSYVQPAGSYHDGGHLWRREQVWPPPHLLRIIPRCYSMQKPSLHSRGAPAA